MASGGARAALWAGEDSGRTQDAFQLDAFPGNAAPRFAGRSQASCMPQVMPQCRCDDGEEPRLALQQCAVIRRWKRRPLGFVRQHQVASWRQQDITGWRSHPLVRGYACCALPPTVHAPHSTPRSARTIDQTHIPSTHHTDTAHRHSTSTQRMDTSC